jgi:hypothetical protein
MLFQTVTRPMSIVYLLKEIAEEKGKYILSFIGAKGIMPELSSHERVHYAPTFYHGSTSFVKYIAEPYDITTLLAGISVFSEEQETIEKLTGKSLATLKKEWLNKLKIVE